MNESVVKFATTGEGAFMLSLGVALAWAIAAAFGFRAWWFMSPRHINADKARRTGTIFLLIMLVFVNGLMAYVDQFAILVDLIIEALALLALNRWAIRTETAAETHEGSQE